MINLIKNFNTLNPSAAEMTEQNIAENIYEKL